MLRIKRVYDEPQASDGYRLLVDRLWPRGLSKASAALDLWLKDIAPSPLLREWFHHDQARFEEFSEKYRQELARNPAVAELRRLIKQHGTVTLLYAARDERINHARVLRDYLG